MQRMTEVSTYPFVQLGGLDGNGIGLRVPLQLVVARLLLDDLPEKEREQLLVVARLREVLAEALLCTYVSNMSGNYKHTTGKATRGEQGGLSSLAVHSDSYT